MNEGAAPTARLLLVDDHPAVREGVRLLLEQQSVVICGEAGDSASALAAVTAAKPDLVMVDLSLGSDSGLVLLRALAARLPGVPLLVYSMYEDAFHVQQAFADGASGYVTKRELTALLVLAVRELLAGKRYVSPRVEEALGTNTSDGPEPEPLSPRELRVYAMLGKGYGGSAIAEALGVSRRTVDSYFARILEKLGVSGMEALRRRAAADRL